MNNDTCNTTDSFGFRRDIGEGERVRITIKATGMEFDAKTRYKILAGNVSGSFYIDGMSMSNIFKACDIDVEVVEPPIEPGFYLNARGVIFRITGKKMDHPRLVNLAAMSRMRDQVFDTAISREMDYYKEIREGKTVRIADLAGMPVSA